MNERITEIAEQCGFRSNPNIYDRNQSFDIEKFAQLIVKECAMVVENLPPGYKDYRDQIEDAFRRDCLESIKSHFGVE